MSAPPQTGEQKPLYITTPIYYVNGLPHVGSALTTVACDVLTRYHKFKGEAVYFLTGTDENATKVQDAAEKAGVSTQQFVDELAVAFRECWDALHIGYDDFIRTTEPRHTHAVQVFFERLIERGHVYLDTYEGWYSVSDETFFRDTDVENGIAKETGKPVVRVTEENYFFRLSAFGDRLLAHIEQNPDWLLPEFRKNEVVAFIKEGLRDISISRPNRGWGIPFSSDPTKIIYVWVDALINYLAATGWPDSPGWDKLWPADLHFMGKEIFVRFHATLWPAMLMALDLPLPTQIYAHGWWTIGGSKGGKTGPALPHPTRLTQFLIERTGMTEEIAVDAQRYLLCREMNFGPDTEFSVENLLRRYNNDLANDLGNLLNRTIGMMTKYYDSVTPEGGLDAEVGEVARVAVLQYEASLKEFRFNIALEAAGTIVARANKFIDEKAPWSLSKAANNGDSAAATELALTMRTCLEVVRISALLVLPFMPRAAQELYSQLGLSEKFKSETFEATEWGGLVSGAKVGPARPVFPRIQELTVDEETLLKLGSSYTGNSASLTENDPTTLNSTKTNSTPKENLMETITNTTPTTQPAEVQSEMPPGTLLPPPLSAQEEETLINIDEFMKVQLKVGEVLAAERIPNADKLLRLTIDLGEPEARTILAGIAEYYVPEDLVGKKVTVVANLQPRKMRGIMSQGMLLAADVDGKASLLLPDQNTPIGSRVR